MKSFSGMTKRLTEAGMDGVTLYATEKGFAVVKTMARKVLPATLDHNITELIVAATVAIGADMVLPSRFARLAGAVAAANVISGFVNPTVDPVLAKAGLIDTITVPVGIAAPSSTGGYATRMGSYAGERGMAGYASVRGMGGYTSGMGNAGQIFPTVNQVGLPG